MESIIDYKSANEIFERIQYSEFDQHPINKIWNFDPIKSKLYTRASTFEMQPCRSDL